jgi:hypothetical protein
VKYIYYEFILIILIENDIYIKILLIIGGDQKTEIIVFLPLIHK